MTTHGVWDSTGNRIVELLLVYPWKCLVHLSGDKLGLGLGVCTLGLSLEAVEAALCFAQCPELDTECLRGSGCSGHAHCRSVAEVQALSVGQS